MSATMTSANTGRLRLGRDPVRLLLSAAPWSAAWYLLAYLFTGTLLFAVALTAGTVAVTLSFTLAGIPLLLAAAAVIRWCAGVERARLRPLGGHVATGYRSVEGQRLLARLGTRWRDPATWRDLACICGLYAPLLAFDAAVLSVWLTFLAGITLPAWYSYPRQSWTIGVSGNATSSAHGVQLGYFPNGPHSPGSWGVYVDTLPKAFAVAAVCLVLFLLWNYVLVATARLHVRIARVLLRAPEDPLHEAKEVLASPGPLERFIQNGPVASGAAPGPTSTGG